MIVELKCWQLRCDNCGYEHGLIGPAPFPEPPPGWLRWAEMTSEGNIVERSGHVCPSCAKELAELGKKIVPFFGNRIKTNV
jgi:hypothetical protein